MVETMANEFIPNCSGIETLDESVGSRGIYYRLGESEFFEYANTHALVGGIKMIDVIPRMVLKDQGFIHVSLQMLDRQTVFELFESGRFKMACKKTLREMLDKGQVIMVYSDKYRLPVSIPYIAQTKSKNDATIYVNISDFVEMDQYGQFSVKVVRNYNALMALILAGCLTYRIVTLNSSLPSDLADGMVLLYASMMESVINSMVHMDPLTREKIRYLSSEFCLVQMYGTQTGLNMFSRLRNSYFPKLSKLMMDAIDNQFDEDAFDKFTLWVGELTRIYPSLRGLTTYAIYDKWIKRYGPATAMSIDYLGYHIYTICMILMESPLTTRTTLEPMMEKCKGADMFRRIQAIIGV